jgi:hypothetical protein
LQAGQFIKYLMLAHKKYCCITTFVLLDNFLPQGRVIKKIVMSILYRNKLIITESIIIISPNNQVYNQLETSVLKGQ